MSQSLVPHDAYTMNIKRLPELSWTQALDVIVMMREKKD